MAEAGAVGSGIGPTEIQMDVEALDRAARTMESAAGHAARGSAHMGRGRVSPTSFGLMNVALGDAVVPLTSHATALAAGLADVAHSIASNTRVLQQGWTRVEEEATDAAARLARLLDEAEVTGR